jgi:hypothetical protein
LNTLKLVSANYTRKQWCASNNGSGEDGLDWMGEFFESL